MPYVPKNERDNDVPMSLGQLNYMIHELIESYLQDAHGYVTYAGVIGTLEAVKLEMYRRLVAPYEDQKCKENGDVDLYTDA